MTNPALLREAEGTSIEPAEAEAVLGSELDEAELVFRLRRDQEATA